MISTLDPPKDYSKTQNIHGTFPCCHTLQRLRESYDEREQEPKTMKIVRMEYIVALTGEDGKTELPSLTTHIDRMTNPWLR